MRAALALAVLLLAAPVSAADLSGVYGQLTLGLDGDKLTGIFDEARIGNGTEEAPQFTCHFLLSGKLRQGRAEIRAWSPGDEAISGTLVFTDDAATLRLGDELPGCGMTSGLNTDQDYELPRDETGAWIAVRMVGAKRAYFHKQPKEFLRGKAYLLRGDTVRVLETRADWVRAEFPGAKKPVIGWLRVSDFVPSTK